MYATHAEACQIGLHIAGGIHIPSVEDFLYHLSLPPSVACLHFPDMSAPHLLLQGSPPPRPPEQGAGMVWRKYEEAQAELGRARQENADLKHKHGEALKRIDSYIADFKKTLAKKDDEIAQLKSQISSKELGDDQLDKDGFREEVKAIVEGLQNDIPGETLLEKLSSLVQQYESTAALEESLLHLRAEFQRLKSTHSAPSLEVARLREENLQLKEENSQLKMRLAGMSDKVEQLRREEQEVSRLKTSNEVCTLTTNHFAF